MKSYITKLKKDKLLSNYRLKFGIFSLIIYFEFVVLVLNFFYLLPILCLCMFGVFWQT